MNRFFRKRIEMKEHLFPALEKMGMRAEIAQKADHLSVSFFSLDGRWRSIAELTVDDGPKSNPTSWENSYLLEDATTLCRVGHNGWTCTRPLYYYDRGDLRGPAETALKKVVAWVRRSGKVSLDPETNTFNVDMVQAFEELKETMPKSWRFIAERRDGVEGFSYRAAGAQMWIAFEEDPDTREDVAVLYQDGVEVNRTRMDEGSGAAYLVETHYQEKRGHRW
ncbi:hypothetical protein [Rhizobium laguerreae]|uniref:hypothetical protein n=2 Tax=Rhizobium laguerreae TaxID=1076926 RepID=UPI001C9035A0|nr:hypothetical protein [Rhizobium laguerreae]MBY3048732.1 hypothetical protein [Rhizobium laguerreae]